MNAFLIKVLAVGLTISQVFTRPAGPNQVQTNFPISTDAEKAESIKAATALLIAGCGLMQTHMAELGLGDIKIESLLTELVPKSQLPPGTPGAASKGSDDDDSEDAPLDTGPSSQVQIAPSIANVNPALSKLGDVNATVTANPLLMLNVYRQLCLGQAPFGPGVDLVPVLNFYNEALKSIPDHTKLVNYKLPQSSEVLLDTGAVFTEISENQGRRRNISIKDMPAYISRAFTSAEDQNFYKHNGLDLNGLLRAFSSGKTAAGHFQGGSTITQQVIKNRLVGDAPNYERKIVEMVLASRLETVMSKDQILELYINGVYMGRSSWGIDMAAQSYLGKNARQLTPAEAAFLAGLVQGPGYNNPVTHLDRAMGRRHYVLDRMHKDGVLNDQEFELADKSPAPTLVAYEAPSEKSAYYFLDAIKRDAQQTKGIKSLTDESYVISSTMNPDLQRGVEEALANGLVDFENKAAPKANQPLWEGPEGNIGDDLETSNYGSWQEIMPNVRSRYYDIHWPLGTVTQIGTIAPSKKSRKNQVQPKNYRIGLADGRELPLTGRPEVMSLIKRWDLVHVRIDENKKSATLMVPPHVQGAAVVLEAKTGRVLALDGGFSFGGSQYNRAGFMGRGRQVGSTIKPFADMAALQAGYQPDTLVPNQAFTIPLGNGKKFSFKNSDGIAEGLISMRVSIEDSLNIPTMQLACRAYGDCPSGLQHITKTLGDFVYEQPLADYSVILGAQESQLLNMAAAYATFSNVSTLVNPGCPQCLRPIPHVFDRIEQNGKLIWNRTDQNSLRAITSVDRTSIYTMNRILSGGPARGTTKALSKWKGFLGCKTGTTNGNRDALMICFTNDVVVAVWVGYDVKQTLGPSGTGAGAALPIGEKIFEKVFEIYGAPAPLAPAPADVAKNIVERPLPDFGVEVLRLDNGQPIDTRFALLNDSERQIPVAGEVRNADNEPAYSGPRYDTPNAQDADGYDDSYGNGYGNAPRARTANRYRNTGPDTDFQSWDRGNPRQYDPDYNVF